MDGGASSDVAGEQAPPPLPPLHRFACARRARTANLQGSNFFSGGKLPSEEIAANPAYTPPGSIEVREGLRALSRSPGVECGGAARRDYVERFVRLPGTAGGRGDGCGAHRGGFTKLYIISPRIAIDRRARRCYNPSNPVCYSGFEAVTAIFVRNLHKCACIISAMHL